MEKLTMNDLIKREDAIAELWDMTTEDCPTPGAAVGKCMEAIRHLPSADRPLDYDEKAIPIDWINKHLEWLDNCDNEFAGLAKVSIKAMMKRWKLEKMTERGR